MSQRRKMLLTAVGVILISMMVGTVSLAAKKVTVTIWGWDIMAKSAETQAEIFQVTYPNVKINGVTMGFGDVRTKVTTSLLAGVGAPDIFFASTPIVNSYIELGGILDLTEEVMPWKDHIAKPWLDSNTGPEGKIWAFPWDAGIGTVFYRKEVFDKAGLEFPDTWQDFIDAGKKLTVDRDGDGEIDQYMLAVPSANPMVLNWYAMFAQSKGILFTNASGDVLYDSEPAIEVFQWATDLVLKHKIADVVANFFPGGSAYWAAFKKGKYVCDVRASWLAGTGPKRLGYNPEHEWRIAPMLSWEKGKKTGATWGGSGMLVPEQTKNLKETLAFVKFICVTRGSQVYNWIKYDKLPVFEPAWDIISDIPDSFFGDQKVNKIWADELKVTPGWTYGPNYSALDSAFRELLPDMLKGKVSVREALSSAKKKAESLIK